MPPEILEEIETEEIEGEENEGEETVVENEGGSTVVVTVETPPPAPVVEETMVIEEAQADEILQVSQNSAILTALELMSVQIGIINERLDQCLNIMVTQEMMAEYSASILTSISALTISQQEEAREEPEEATQEVPPEASTLAPSESAGAQPEVKTQEPEPRRRVRRVF